MLDSPALAGESLHPRESFMKPKMISLALGAWALLAGLPCFAALSATEQGYVEKLVNGDWAAIRSAAQRLSGNTNTAMLDIAAQVLLEKYPQAGEIPGAVDAMSWLCRTIGKSDNSRYRPVLEQVENDKAAHRKLREHCERGMQWLSWRVPDPYVAGTVKLAALRAEFAAAPASSR